jgi:coatomer subunit beta
MTVPEQYCYTLVDNSDQKDAPSVAELKAALEQSKDEGTKIEAMRQILLLMLNGDPVPQLLMHVIRFVMPSKSKALKKLLLIYWEICPKTNPDGKLKQEMILVW